MPKPKSNKTLQVVFDIPSGGEAFGTLALKRSKTRLELWSESHFLGKLSASCLRGKTLEGERVTCIDCVTLSESTAYKGEVPNVHKAKVFPHFVATGPVHLEPDAPCIQSLQFGTEDLARVFYDFEAFGIVPGGKELLGKLLADTKRAVAVGEAAHIAYYTGKFEVITVDTAIGTFSVNHGPSFSIGEPGVSMKDTMRVSLRFPEAKTLPQATDAAMILLRFLSHFAGRIQAPKGFEVKLSSDQSLSL